MVGELVGAAVVEILLGKGIGKAGSILEKTKTGAEIIEKAKSLKSATTAKIAEAFSDEAAALAKQNAQTRLRQLASQLNTGLPFDPQLAKELTVIAANKLKNGAISFKQFVGDATKELGEGLRGRVDELATAYRAAMQNLGFGNEIVELDIEQTSKLAKMQFQRETNAARQKLLNGIQEAENSGVLEKIKNRNPDDYNWLQQNPRHKELAFDPDKKQFKVKEAQAALEAERQGLIKGPVSRGIYADGKTHGDDYFDGNGVAWDMKEAIGGSDLIVDSLKKGENVIVDARELSGTELETLKTEIEAKRPSNNKKLVFVR